MSKHCRTEANLTIKMINQKISACLQLILMVLIGAFLGLSPLEAKDEVKVIVLVNGEPITNLELADRTSYLRRVAQLQITEETLRRDALQGLIADRLKMQFGKNIVPELVPQLHGRARQILDENFGRGGKLGSVVLKELNIPQRTILNKIKADILWGNALRLKFKRQFQNIEKTALQELDRLKQLKSEPQIRFSEIILLPNPNRSPEATLSLASQIVKALNNGADFASIAQQYSDAGSASKGGFVDWVFTSRLPEQIRNPLISAESGSVIGPLSFGGQIFVLRKGEMRENGQLDLLATKVSLVRAVAPIPLTSSVEQRQLVTEMIIQKTQAIESCSELADFANTLSPDIPATLNGLTIGSLSPQLQSVVKDLDVGDKTAPLAFTEGMVVFMLCEKNTPELDLPELKEIEQAELEKLLSTLSGRFLLRLQRQASITYKDVSI